MSELNGFDENGTEWFIPPCILDIRLADSQDRAIRNPASRERQANDFKHISYLDAGDGDMIVRCAGTNSCCGGEIKVDRHDILQSRMPETTIALRGICSSKERYYSQRGILRPHVVID